MPADPLSTLGPSDSGFLNSFLPPKAPPPLQSRVGEDAQDGPAAGDAATPHDSESVLDPDPAPANGSAADGSTADGPAADGGLTDERLDRMLRTTPTPEGMLTRLHQIFDG